MKSVWFVAIILTATSFGALAQGPEAKTKPIEVPRIDQVKPFAGISKGIIFEVATGQKSTVDLPVPDDASGPPGNPQPANGQDFSFPIEPPIPALAKLTVLASSDLGSCVALAVGDRVFVTAA